MSFPQKTVAIFGATGGTGLATLKYALAAGSHVNVLARTPAKLSELSTQYPSTLHITTGDIRSIPSLKTVLLAANGQVVDVVISSIGMLLERKGLSFTSADPHICEEGTQSILTALSELEAEGKIVKEPELVILSTTGISTKGRDIPIAMVPLYHYVLSVPHEDKKKVEWMMVTGAGKNRKWILIRPSFLADGAAKGLEKVRCSAERPGMEKEEDTAIGYTINREDVGLWIVENSVKANAEKWVGKFVTLTY